MSFAQCFLVLAMAVSTDLVTGSHTGFLKTRSDGSGTQISKQEVQLSLLEEIESSIGSGAAAKKLKQLEAQLQPMYNALPKNEHGGLSREVVRYALHRIFVQRHGWVVKGLDPAGDSFNSSSPAGVLKDQVPAYIQSLFEDRLHGKGMGLHELAVFAATIEHLIHNEAVGKLGDALNVQQILPTSAMTEKEADEVLDTYMMAYIVGEDLTNMTIYQAADTMKEMPELYPAWKETQEYMRRKRASITAGTQSNEINFATLAKVAEDASEHFGVFQNKDCQELKNKLVAMEDRGSGRIRLADFYKPALDGAWEFQESVSYLRQLGALDESDSKDKRVILANYLTSQTNCIASSSFYSVCCIDECEALIGQLEKEIAAPEAFPEQIVSLVGKQSSSSVTAPRSLPSALLDRLEGIAATHAGTVPIHGRLFAQWMHHAFPRECPYPHLSGTYNPQLPDEFESNGQMSIASEAEMLQYSSPFDKKESAAATPEVEELEELQMPWSFEEELITARIARPYQSATSMQTALRKFAMFALLISVAIGFFRTFKSALPMEDYKASKLV